MTTKHFYTWQDIDNAVNKFVTDMYIDMWKPDYIVGLTRGGLPLAVSPSNKIDVPMKTLDVSFRDSTLGGPESNLQMAEDAFGQFQQGHGHEGKNILIVDDINDTGATFNWIKNDWQNCHLPESHVWEKVWGNNVRFAVLTENLSSEFSSVDYWVHEVNKAEEDVWLVYPWEM